MFFHVFPQSTAAPVRLFPRRRQATSACTAPVACARRRPPSWRTRAGRSAGAGDGSNRSWFQPVPGRDRAIVMISGYCCLVIVIN